MNEMDDTRFDSGCEGDYGVYDATRLPITCVMDGLWE